MRRISSDNRQLAVNFERAARNILAFARPFAAASLLADQLTLDRRRPYLTLPWRGSARLGSALRAEMEAGEIVEADNNYYEPPAEQSKLLPPLDG